ncbi:cytochrome P450 [Aspergillus crustosus]
MALDEGVPLEAWGPIDGLQYVLLLLATYILLRLTQSKSTIPLINGKKRFELSGHRVRNAFLTQLPDLLQAGLAKADVFRLLTPAGMRFVLAPKFAHEIPSHPGLSPGEFTMANMNAHISGFEVLSQTSQHHIVQDAVRTKLTRKLSKSLCSITFIFSDLTPPAKLTKPLSDETAVILKEQWTDDPTWHELSLSPSAITLISRLSSMVFVGNKIGRNAEWLELVVNYSAEVFSASNELNLWPRVLRPLVAHFSPSCRRLRHYIQRARSILLPVVKERRKANASGAEGDIDDAIQWFEEVANGTNFDPTLTQLTLALGSIHTSSDLLNQVIIDLCERSDWEELACEMRKEITNALDETGWQKIALNNLKLMDSILKESQRMKPASLVTLGRKATQTMQLSDGTIIPSGSSLFVANVAMRDPKIYPNPDSFDPYRFSKLRDAGDNSAYLVSPSPAHLGFGLGEHACPGRFFVANEIKIILCHMLMKYDMKLVDGYKSSTENIGITYWSNRAAKILVRRRQEETTF